MPDTPPASTETPTVLHRRIRRSRLLIIILLVLVAALGLLLWLTRRAPGIEVLPALTVTELAALPEDQLLGRMQTDLSRRIGADWHRLPEVQRHLWVVGALEEGLCGKGFLEPALVEGVTLTHQPHLSELAASYRALALEAPAAVVDEALRIRAGATALLQAWARYDLADPARGAAPVNPFTANDLAFRQAVTACGSVAARRAWIRRHAVAMLDPGPAR